MASFTVLGVGDYGAEAILRTETVQALFDNVEGAFEGLATYKLLHVAMAPPLYASGSVPVSSASPISDSFTNTSYEKKAEAYCAFTGGVTVKFRVAATHVLDDARAKIYVNGIAVGAEKITSGTSYNAFTQLITGVSVGDLVQVYAYVEAVVDGVGYVKDLQLFGDTSQVSFTNHYPA